MIKESTAYLLTSAMQDVITSPNGTGSAARLSNMPSLGKQVQQTTVLIYGFLLTHHIILLLYGAGMMRTRA